MVFGAGKLEYSLPLAPYANVDVELNGLTGSGVDANSDIGADVAARVFSVSEEADKVKQIISTARNIMPFLNSTLCVVKSLSHPPSRS
jgi:hypothetical protein